MRPPNLDKQSIQDAPLLNDVDPRFLMFYGPAVRTMRIYLYRDFPYPLHGNTPACLKSHNNKI